MPESKAHQETETVLSSVKRIVTRSESGGAEVPAGEGDDPPPAVEKLLLTPALRIDAPEARDARELPMRRTRVQTRTLTAERISLEQRIAELERAVGSDDGFEPDGSEPGDDETPRHFVLSDWRRPPVPTPPVERESRAEALVDEAEVAAGAAPAAPREEPAAQQADLSEHDAERVIDEDLLREIVAEIVREELQGELGERITRNVRKLVRREIHRALMTREIG